MILDGWTLAALGLAAVGATAAVAGRWIRGGGDWARALILTGVAVAESGLAFRYPSGLFIWLSGFFVCIAAHRWYDVFAGASPETRKEDQAAPRRARRRH